MLVVYRTIPTSNHNSCVRATSCAGRCISYYSYIKPQLATKAMYAKQVVYRTIPTSNHNKNPIVGSYKVLYIVLFLHQTTTQTSRPIGRMLLYIVLFLHQTTTVSRIVFISFSCISYYSYIKPQHDTYQPYIMRVVYRTIPTSNHNYAKLLFDFNMLYIVLFLHQTTTQRSYAWNSPLLYIVLFLHQTTTHFQYISMLAELYIVLFLHQTTTNRP